MRTIAMRPSHLYCRSALLLCALVALIAATGAARAPIGAAAWAQGASDADLDVSGSPARMSLRANHADVVAVLSRVLNLARKDFALDPSVIGVVTMRLSNRKWSTIVDEVCRVSFVKYTDKGGVLTFSADMTALRDAVQRSQTISGQLAEQLKYRYGFGAPNWQPLVPAANPKRVELPDWLQRLNYQLNITATGDHGVPYDKLNPKDNPQLFVQVDVVIPKDNPMSVVDCLKQLAAQAKIPIEISPDVTQGHKFRIQGHISNHNFLDTLQILASTARLQWRYGRDGKLYIANAPGVKAAHADPNGPRPAPASTPRPQ
jgi:hypothetical protein